jgi:hypothetical protein
MKFPGEQEAKEAKDDDCDCGECGDCCGPNACGPYRRPSLTDLLLYEGQRAKMELIREKLKRAIEARRGKVYDKLADAIAEHLARQSERGADERAAYDDLQKRITSVLEGKK